MSWNAYSLASGSRDRLILMRDVRASESFTQKLVGHKQEVRQPDIQIGRQTHARAGTLSVISRHESENTVGFGDNNREYLCLQGDNSPSRWSGWMFMFAGELSPSCRGGWWPGLNFPFFRYGTVAIGQIVLLVVDWTVLCP